MQGVKCAPVLLSSRSPAPGMSAEVREKRLLKPSAASSTRSDRLGSVGKNDSGVAFKPPVTARIVRVGCEDTDGVLHKALLACLGVLQNSKTPW